MSKQSHGIRVKKQYGQHFLRNPHVVIQMLDAVNLTDQTSVFEIGCGDGFLTRHILQTSIARLWVFEIDPEWVAYVSNKIKDDRLTVHHQDFLDLDFNVLKPHAPWTVLANLPYQVTFPILYRFQQHRELITEGVVMVQEEVAQKILKTSGRGYGFVSLFFQWYFEWKKLAKVSPVDFYPPPKVLSRLLHFQPKKNVPVIPSEEKFWKFVKSCFKQPRRTLANNLKSTTIDLQDIPGRYLPLRAQQMGMDDFLAIWKVVDTQKPAVLL